VQRSLFIAYDYWGFKRRKLCFLHPSNLENKQIVITEHVGKQGAAITNAASCAGAHMLGTGEHLAVSYVRFLAFSSRCRSFFHLETPKNLKWIFFTSYCLKKTFKEPLVFNYISLMFHVMSWFVDLYDFSLQITQNTYGVAWYTIKVNYNDSSENNTIFSSNHSQPL